MCSRADCSVSGSRQWVELLRSLVSLPSRFGGSGTVVKWDLPGVTLALDFGLAEVELTCTASSFLSLPLLPRHVRGVL
jgi:hypothetical protein